ncbi:MAG: T9SS type A sorting domain-containing protein [Flavobacteriales bacterium]|nr:T9SS type A sorting domain-containing protein [Flavobacteriales bacterium]
MKKNYTLTIVFILTTSLGFSQGITDGLKSEAKAKITKDYPIITNPVSFIQKKQTKLKALGDTLYRETFANQIPSGWVAANNTGNSNNWVWSNSAPGGQYSTLASAINSTTASNGFMLMPADLYNTPFPSGTPIGMDATISSPAITIPASASVVLQWEQSYRYCCLASDELVVEISTNNQTWTSYDAKLGRGASVSVPSPTSNPAEIVRLTVSSQLANQTTVYIRFRMTGATHYYWMIDDVMLIEGATNAMELTDYSINFSNLTFNPSHTIVPFTSLYPLTFTGQTFNAGSNTQTGVGLEVAIVQDSTYSGMPGAGVVDLKTTMLGSSVPSLQRDTIGVGTHNSNSFGYFRAVFNVLSTAPNQNPSAATGSQSFIVSDSVLAKDKAPYIGVAGTGNFVGGGMDGDMWASLMTTGPCIPNICNSISILIPNTQTVVGSKIEPRLWIFDDQASSLSGLVGNLVGSSPFFTIIDTTMLGNWVTIPLIPAANLSPNEQYLVGWEQTGGASVGAEFSAARSISTEAKQPDYTNLINVGGTWGWVRQVAAVRMNLGCFTSINSNSESLSNIHVFPNPSNGELKMNVTSSISNKYSLSIRNVLGQVIYTDQWQVKGEQTKSIDLSSEEKGIYFISIQNGADRMTKKIVLK